MRSYRIFELLSEIGTMLDIIRNPKYMPRHITNARCCFEAGLKTNTRLCESGS